MKSESSFSCGSFHVIRAELGTEVRRAIPGRRDLDGSLGRLKCCVLHGEIPLKSGTLVVHYGCVQWTPFTRRAAGDTTRLSVDELDASFEETTLVEGRVHPRVGETVPGARDCGRDAALDRADPDGNRETELGGQQLIIGRDLPAVECKRGPRRESNTRVRPESGIQFGRPGRPNVGVNDGANCLRNVGGLKLRWRRGRGGRREWGDFKRVPDRYKGIRIRSVRARSDTNPVSCQKGTEYHRSLHDGSDSVNHTNLRVVS
jgi:hypothetical protein